MPLPNTENSLAQDLSDLGPRSGMTVMVHSSLGKVGWTVGGPVTIVRALLEVLGVGFNRCTSLHYAESLVPYRRITIHRYPMIAEGQRKWVENEDMANDDGVHFPVVGEEFIATRSVCCGRVGEANSMFFSTRKLVDFAESYFVRELK